MILYRSDDRPPIKLKSNGFQLINLLTIFDARRILTKTVTKNIAAEHLILNSGYVSTGSDIAICEGYPKKFMYKMDVPISEIPNQLIIKAFNLSKDTSLSGTVPCMDGTNLLQSEILAFKQSNINEYDFLTGIQPQYITHYKEERSTEWKEIIWNNITLFD